ncbi:MAG: zinc ribbon domain-containing protein [bacterium]
MPIYEYECRSCSKRSELLVRSAEEQVRCPNCGSEQLTRLLSTFSAHGGSSSGGSCDSCDIGEACASVGGKKRGPCCSGGCNH